MRYNSTVELLIQIYKYKVVAYALSLIKPSVGLSGDIYIILVITYRLGGKRVDYSRFFYIYIIIRSIYS